MTEQLDGQIMLAEIAAQEDEQADAEYEAFVEKFKPKKRRTTATRRRR